MSFLQDMKRLNMRYMVAIIFAITLAACASQDTPSPEPTAPSLSGNNVIPSAEFSSRMLWGYWEGYIPPTHETIELNPAREANMHLNARRFLEDTACKTCLKISNINFDLVQMTASCDLQLTHPFPGFDRFTGFDVRGIVISDGSRYFPSLDVTMPDATLGDFTLTNPDGYTRLWNTVDFPPGSGAFKIQEYSQGKKATPGGFTGTVNPYIEFTQDPRSCFPAGAAITRSLTLKLKAGGLKFGYVVDASWAPPTVDPPVDLMTDFPENANAIEPYVMSAHQDDMLFDQINASGTLAVDLVDRQEDSAYSTVQMECPDLWDGFLEAGMWSATPGEPLWHETTPYFTIVNAKGAPEGTYLAMFKIADSSYPDPYLGDINHRYAPIWITVTHKEPPQLKGKIVFVAPGPDDPFGEPGAANVFVLDVETKVETQITDFKGVGILFKEPRINPKGTHVLITIGPTPMYSSVEVFELGTTNSWIATPSGSYDGTANFAPDGIHIIAASGTQYGDTKDLVSMEYDGSNRTLIATAPRSVECPAWSPDGTRIAMTIADEDPSNPMAKSLWLYDSPSDQFSELSPSPAIDANPSWSPVKEYGFYWIAFDSTRMDPNNPNTWIFEINPDYPEGITWLVPQAHHPSFSPDGLSLVYSYNPEPAPFDSELGIYILCSEITQLTDDDTYDESPSWSWGW
jgi:Tol biopolymer transport system component